MYTNTKQTLQNLLVKVYRLLVYYKPSVGINKKLHTYKELTNNTIAKGGSRLHEEGGTYIHRVEIGAARVGCSCPCAR